jgi:hypothetical protein
MHLAVYWVRTLYEVGEVSWVKTVDRVGVVAGDGDVDRVDEGGGVLLSRLVKHFEYIHYVQLR